jgi:hypothetical protein
MAVVSEQLHRLRFRRFRGHATSIWCSCGWSEPFPVKVVKHADIEQTWRKHIDAP